MAFTDSGYDVIKYRDIQEGVRLGLETSLGMPVSADPDSVFGIVSSIYSNEVAKVENNIQALVSNLSIFTAEGIYLDELVRYIGIARRSKQSASGSLKVWRNGEGLVPTSLLFSTTSGENYLVPAGLAHDITNCAEVLLSPVAVAEGNVYTLVINTTTFTYTALLADIATDVVDYFVTAIASSLPLTTSNDADKLRISSADDLNALDNTLTNFTVDEVATFAYAESVSKKKITVVENTIIEVVTNNSNILRSNNPLPFVDGADVESDEELRARHQLSIQVGGNATVPAITAKLLQVPGVTQAFLVENTTMITDVDGRPAKSYETYVLGGDPAQVGAVVWDTKPAGVQTWGDINTTVVDNTGKQQNVYWSRPESVYIFVRVTYKLYDEEVFPATGETTMADTVKEYGDSLGIGKDIIATRFIGSLYGAVDGIDEISVEIGYSLNIGDSTPTGGYTTTTIPITANQNSDFATARITMVQTV